VHILKDAAVKTGAESSAFTVSFIRGLKEGFCKIEGHRKKDVMVG
jgi:hypothetical protein